MLLQTYRPIIEHFKDRYISDLAKIESNANVRRLFDEKMLSFEESRKYVEMNIRQYQKIGDGDNAVRLKEKGNLLVCVAC